MVLWLHESDTPVFEVIHISGTPISSPLPHPACPIPPVGGVAGHSIAMSDLFLKKEVRASCSVYFVRVHTRGGTCVEPFAVRVQYNRVAL